MSDSWVEQFNLAKAKREGDRAAAEALYEKALVGCKKQHGTDHLDVAKVQTYLACLFCSERDFAAAEPLFRRALAIRKKQLGPTHRRVAVDLMNLALALMSKGDLAEAELLLQRAVAIHKDPEDVARVEKDLATVRRRIAKILERPGEESLKFATSLHTLAKTKYQERDFAAAEPLCQRSLDIRIREQLGPDDSDIMESMCLLWDVQQMLVKQYRAAAAAAAATAATPPPPRQRSEEDDCVFTGSRSPEERDAELKRNAIVVDDSDAEGSGALEDHLTKLRDGFKSGAFDFSMVLRWCEKNGMDELSEIAQAEMIDEFVTNLALEPAKAQVLKKLLRVFVAGGG